MIATMTTARRPELFDQTVRSFAKNCADLPIIDKLMIFDDSSTVKDRAFMRDVCDSHGIQCGIVHQDYSSHAKNLNEMLAYILNPLSGDYVLHLEDDWTLSHRGSYVMAALDVMLHQPEIGQVCLGRAEHNHRDNFTAIEKTPTGTNYRLAQPFSHKKRWCPFTLNPSLFRITALRQVGHFDTCQNFEYNYGAKFSAAGWLTAHLAPDCLQHIGHGNSAYDLNKALR